MCGGVHFPSVKLFLVTLEIRFGFVVDVFFLIVEILFVVDVLFVVEVLILCRLIISRSIGVVRSIYVVVNGGIILINVRKLYLVAVFIKNFDVKAECLKLLNKNLEGLGDTGCGNVLSLDDRLVGLVRPVISSDLTVSIS